MIPEVKAGIYKHHDRLYLFDKIVRLDTDDSVWITYVPLWTHPDYRGPRTSARPIEQFLREFEWIGSTYEGEGTATKNDPIVAPWERRR